ncbi:hypothetical protein M0804_014977 [Polistes exclamans]|nr:hypothetical protein M0804_014977 [Polistes exclamans]
MIKNFSFQEGTHPSSNCSHALLDLNDRAGTSAASVICLLTHKHKRSSKQLSVLKLALLNLSFVQETKCPHGIQVFNTN